MRHLLLRKEGRIFGAACVPPSRGDIFDGSVPIELTTVADAVTCARCRELLPDAETRPKPDSRLSGVKERAPSGPVCAFCHNTPAVGITKVICDECIEVCRAAMERKARDGT